METFGCIRPKVWGLHLSSGFGSWVDINSSYIENAKKRFSATATRFMIGDITVFITKEKVDATLAGGSYFSTEKQIVKLIRSYFTVK